jgi:hypothetical protein
MVSAAERPEGIIALGCAQSFRGQSRPGISFPGMFQVKPDFGPAIESGLSTEEVCLEQRHPAPDVTSDEVRIDHPVGDKCGADGSSSSGLQIGKSDGQLQAGQLRGGIELSDSFAIDPHSSRCEQTNFGFSGGSHTVLVKFAELNEWLRKGRLTNRLKTH